MRLLVNDGLRHTRLSGYGMLSRNIILQLHERGHEVRLQRGRRDWDVVENGARERLEELPIAEDLEGLDLVLQIGTPASCHQFPLPSLIYTQNALGDLPEAWIKCLRQADGCIVPGEFDRRVFTRYFDRVSVAQQSSDPKIFKPMPGRREDGSRRFTFLFVGSFSFRKGVDLLLDAYLEEFDPDEEVELQLHCEGIGRGNEFNYVLDTIKRINQRANVRLFGRALPPQSMAGLYNRSDCLITMTRGEGWCMPITEALLCGVPVIAPNSTAMSEYLTDETASLIPAREREIAGISDPLSHAFVETYGKPGNVCYEPSTARAREAMRGAFENPERERARAAVGRKHLIENITWTHTAAAIEDACRDLLKDRGGEPVHGGPAATSAASRRGSHRPGERPMASVFSAAYESNKWKGSESRSGPGAAVAVAAGFDRVLPQLCRAYEVDTLLDAPCGDFNWMKELDLPVRQYIGVDVVRSVIEENQAKYANDQRQFQIADITRDPLPASDLVLCRDCLVHLVAEDAIEALRRFRESSRLVLTTTFYALVENIPGSTGGWRPINLQLAPFSLPPPIALIPERSFDPGSRYSDKSLGLWDLSELDL